MHNRQRHSPCCAPYRQRAKRQRQYRNHESLHPDVKQSAATVDCIDPRNIIPRSLRFFVSFFFSPFVDRDHFLPSPRTSPTSASSRAHFLSNRHPCRSVIPPPPPFERFRKNARISHFVSRISVSLPLQRGLRRKPTNSSVRGSSIYLFVLRLRDLTVLLSKPVSCVCVVISIHARDILFPLCYPHGWTPTYCCCYNSETSSNAVFSSFYRLSHRNFYFFPPFYFALA